MVDAPDARQGASPRPAGDRSGAAGRIHRSLYATRRAQALGRARRPRPTPPSGCNGLQTTCRTACRPACRKGGRGDGFGPGHSNPTFQQHAGAVLWAGSPRAPASPTPVIKDAAFVVVAASRVVMSS